VSAPTRAAERRTLPARVLVVGCSGSGKTTLSAELARRSGAPHVELDALEHGPGWQRSSDEDFRRGLERALAAGRWIVDGSYLERTATVWAAAELVVWLDYERALLMRRVARRTLVRWVRRQELWNGNRERLRDWSRGSHPLRHTWRNHARNRRSYEGRQDDRWLRLRTPAETSGWLSSLGTG
jgi:adenylate kinase family enzyme